MTIDEAIAHAREIAEKNYLEGMLCHANPDDGELDGCIECGREHEQLAEWLEELKKYQQYGTPDGYESALKAYDDCYFEKEEISNELQEYKQLGTLEKVREAVERQQAKKPIIQPWFPARCPTCGEELSESLGDGYYRHRTFLERCTNVECAQRLDWGEEE